MNVPLGKTKKTKLTSSDDVYAIMRQILLRENKIDRAKEHFWTIGLDGSLRVLYIELICLGTSNSTPVEPMQVFRVAVLKAASRIILVHNHPSGSVKPSDNDTIITDRLIQVGNILGIDVEDHLIITEKTYNSFKDTGMMDKLRDSKLYVPDYKIKAGLKKEVEKMIKAETEKNRSKEIGRQMKEKGYTTQQIKEITGLTEREIKKL